jgi:hypothetical protein
MNSNQITLALSREKELLEQVLAVAECQLGLIESGRIEDLEVLLMLREAAMSEMEMIESQADSTLASEDIHELQDLNLAIVSLANRIAVLDERTEWLAEQYDESTSSQPSAATEAP